LMSPLFCFFDERRRQRLELRTDIRKNVTLLAQSIESPLDAEKNLPMSNKL
jgi:hypothetical protein